MYKKYKFILGEWLFNICAWIVILYLYYFTAFWGLKDFIKSGPIYDYIYSWKPHLELIMQSIIFGFIFSLINTFTERSALRKYSLGIIITVKSIMYIIALFLVGYFTNIFFLTFGIVSEETYYELIKFFSFRFFIVMAIYLTFFIILLNFIIQVNKKFGPGNLRKLITGKYLHPKVEEVIFLFLDLKSSTAIAEKLGHRIYSQFLRNCYHDLTEIVYKYKAEVYQYVGDEVVLIWHRRKGLKNLNCIKAFYAYKNKLTSRESFYLKKFGFAPEFKAGMDMGFVTVAEIGDIKREIAYHGDVLNTASRIQDQCNRLRKELLISENVEEYLVSLNGFKKEMIGEVQLKGKEKQLKIYSIEPKK